VSDEIWSDFDRISTSKSGRFFVEMAVNRRGNLVDMVYQAPKTASGNPEIFFKPQHTSNSKSMMPQTLALHFTLSSSTYKMTPAFGLIYFWGSNRPHRYDPKIITEFPIYMTDLYQWGSKDNSLSTHPSVTVFFKERYGASYCFKYPPMTSTKCIYFYPLQCLTADDYGVPP